MSRLRVTLHAEFVLPDVWGEAGDFLDEDGEPMLDVLAELFAEDIGAVLESVPGADPDDWPATVRSLIQKVEVVP